MGRVAFSEVEIEPLGADSAFVRGRWGLTMPDGKKPGGLFTLIFRKLPEGWKIVHDHTSAAEEPGRRPRPGRQPAPMSEPTPRLRRSLRPVVASGLAAGDRPGLRRARSSATDRSSWRLLMYLPAGPAGPGGGGLRCDLPGPGPPQGPVRARGDRPGRGDRGGPGRWSGSARGRRSGDGPEISVLHWNVLWGAARTRSPASWAAIRREILGQGADLVVLSEAPPDDWLDQLVGDMGPGASRVQVENGPADAYWFKLVVCLEGAAPAAPPRADRRRRGDGRRGRGPGPDGPPAGRRRPEPPAAAPRAEAPGHRRRLPTGQGGGRADRRRGRRLQQPLAEPRLRRDRGRGYALAARSSRGWRGTFPSFLPVYDIDHVFVRRDDPLARVPTLHQPRLGPSRAGRGSGRPCDRPRATGRFTSRPGS